MSIQIDPDLLMCLRNTLATIAEMSDEEIKAEAYEVGLSCHYMKEKLDAKYPALDPLHPSAHSR